MVCCKCAEISKILKINNQEQKAGICEVVLHSLPKWVEVEFSITNYTNDTQSMPFWFAYDDEIPIGIMR